MNEMTSPETSSWVKFFTMVKLLLKEEGQSKTPFQMSTQKNPASTRSPGLIRWWKVLFISFLCDACRERLEEFFRCKEMFITDTAQKMRTNFKTGAFSEFGKLSYGL